MGELAKRTIEALRERGAINEAESDMDILLTTPVIELRRPLAVDSEILGETIYLVPNERMAKEIEPQGKIVYLPEEIKALVRKSKTMSLGDWIAFLKNLHMAKKAFRGSRIQA